MTKWPEKKYAYYNKNRKTQQRDLRDIMKIKHFKIIYLRDIFLSTLTAVSSLEGEIFMEKASIVIRKMNEMTENKSFLFFISNIIFFIFKTALFLT